MDCPICLETMVGTTYITTQCLHKFHFKCLSNCESSSCPLCRQEVDGFRDEDIQSSISTISLDQFEVTHGEVNACPCCAMRPWSCEMVNCSNRICDCSEHNSPFFTARNPIEQNSILNRYVIRSCEFRCIECYKNRDQIAIGNINRIDNYNGINTVDLNDLYESLLEELYYIYYIDTFDTMDETRQYLMNIIMNSG